MNEVAPYGQIFVCTACGKLSHDKYGNQAVSNDWDVSCMLNSVLCHEDKLVIEKSRVVKINEGGFVETSSAQ